MSEIPDLHVVVKFGKAIPSFVQGPALLEFERILRKAVPDAWVEVFKEAKGDDSMLRNRMTAEQRAKL